MKDNISTLYGALKNKGYTDIGKDETEFRNWLNQEGNVKTLYGALSQQGFDDIGDEQQFTDWVGVKKQPKSDDDAVFEANAERFRNGQPTERVTTQSMIDAHPELGLQKQEQKRTAEQYAIENRPEMFGKRNASLLDAPLRLGDSQPEPLYQPQSINNTLNNAYGTANDYTERVNARAEIAERNMKDPMVQKGRTEADMRGLASEIDGLLEEENQKEQNTFIGSAFMPAGARGRSYNESNKERVDNVSNLWAAKRLLEQSQYIVDAAKRGDTGILSDTWQGFKDSLEAEDFTFGLADAASSAAILDAIKKVENGEQLTEAEDKLLRASAINMAVQYNFANDLGRAYKAGGTFGESVPFMLEMAINPISSFGNASAKTLLNYGLKSFAKQVGKGLARGAAAGTGMALTTGVGRVAAGTTDRLAQNYNYGVDFDGNLYAEKKDNPMGVGEAFTRSLASTAIENQSEMIFNAFKPIGGFMKGVQDVLPGGVNKFFDMLSHNKVADAYRWLKKSPVFRNYLVKDVRNATQIGGIFEEYAEEVYNNLANFAIGEMSWDDVVSLDNNIDTFLGLAPTQVMFGLLGLGGAGAMRYQTRRTLEDLQATMNEQQRKQLEGLLDMGLDAEEVDVRGFIRNVMQNENYTIDNKRDMIKAAFYVAKQKGIDQLTEADVIDKVIAENSLIDSVTDPSTGIYAEITAKLPDAKEGTIEVPGNVVGWFGEGEKRQPIFVAEGMENTEENRRVLKPGEWDASSVQEMPAEQVKTVNEEMIREEAAAQAERESKYAPDVLNYVPANGDQVTDENGQVLTITNISPDGVEYLNGEGRIEQMHLDDWKGLMQAQLDAQEAEQKQAEEAAANTQAVVDNMPRKTDETGRIFVPKSVQGDEVAYDITDEQGNVLEQGTSKVSQFAQMQDYVAPVEEQLNDDGTSVSASSESVGEQVSDEVNNPVSQEETSDVVEVQQEPTLESVVAALPKTKKGEIDYEAMTPQQQYQYTSLSESPEVALEDLQADIAANEEELVKMQDELGKARGGKRAELRDKVKKLASANEELKAFYESVAPKQEPIAETGNTKSSEPMQYAAEEVAEESKPIVAETEKPKKSRKPKLTGRKKPQKPSELTDEELRPANGVELAAEQLAAGNVKITIDSYKKETGHGEEERKKMGLTPFRSTEKGGMTIEQAAEKLVEEDNANHNGRMFDGDTMAARDAIIELLGMSEKWSDVTNYIKNNRMVERQKREEAEYAEYEDYIMQAFHMSVSDYESMKEYDEQNNPFEGIDMEGKDAIFAEEYLKYEQYLNSINNDEGRTDETPERSDSVLSQERVGNIGGNQRNESQGFAESVGSEPLYNSEASQESASGIEVAPSIEETNVGRMADIEARILEIEGRRNEISDEIAETPDYDTMAIAELRAEEWELDQEQAELEAEYSGIRAMNDESNAISEAEGSGLRFRESAKEEENRRKPLRDRAKQWSDKLGVKVRIMESLGDVVNPYTRRAIASGQVVTGWFEESTGEVCIYMPHVNSESEVDATYIHEVVAHKGLRGLLGEKFESFCDEVWDMMSDADRLKFMSYPGVSHLEGKEKSRAAADEYIAHLAENIDVTESVWSKLTELVKKFLKAIGIEPKMTNADIANTIKKSYQRLLSGENAEGNVSGEGNRFRITDSDKQKQIDKEYVDAVREGDFGKAIGLFREYVLSKAEENGVVPIDYGVGYRSHSHSSIAKKVKEENPDAISEAAYQMSKRVPKGSILVPMPSRSGKATYTIKLAEAIAKATESKVRDVLKGNERMSVYEAKKKGLKIDSRDLGFYVTEKLPKDKNVVIIDNVIDRGITALAAVEAVDGGSVLAYAFTKGSKDRVVPLKLSDPITYDDELRIIPLSERFNSATNDLRFRIAKEPAVAYATLSQSEDIVDVPSNEVKYTMNNIGAELYKVSGDYMRNLYKNGTLGRVLRGEYAEIDQIKAKEDYDKAKKYLGEYLNELIWMKYQATEAAQDVINDVIRDVEYSIDYYRDLTLGKDVWRTKQSPRFRIIDKKREAIQKEVDKFTSKYNSKPVSLVDSAMTDEELEEAYPTSLAEDARKKIAEGKKGGYSPVSGKIHIFVDNTEIDEVENILFHENLHQLFGKNPIIDEFFKNFDKENPTLAEELRHSYEESEVPEEAFVHMMSQGMVLGKLGIAGKYLSEQSKSNFINTLKAFGYDYEQESERRRRTPEGSNEKSERLRTEGSGVQEVEEGTGIETSGTGSIHGADGRGLEEQGNSQRTEESSKSARERAERLKQLFDNVTDMGLDGVLGNGFYDKAMMDIYSVLPEDARKIVADDALGRPKVDFPGAMNDYLNNVEISIWDKVVGIIREALRKAGFDLDLNSNDVKYILWRSRKPLDRNNLLDVAEDIDMRYRLKVGEHNASTTNGSVLEQIKQARTEVEKNPTEAQKEAGNYKKGHITLDGYDITLENPKGGTRSGTDKNGKKWSITMNNDYGYIRGTEAVDGDHIDIFLSENPTEGHVFVIDQRNEDGSFDESKVMYGFNSLDEARQAYLSNYEKGWENRIMAITEVSKDEFKRWIDSSHRKTKPFSEYKHVKSNGGGTRFRVDGENSTSENPEEPMFIESSEYENLKRQIQKQKMELGRLRKIVSEYESEDQVKDEIVKFIRKQVGSNVTNGVNKSELNILLAQVREAKSKKSIERILNNVRKAVQSAQRRELQRVIDNLLSLKVQDVNGKNMSIAKNVDDSTRKIFEFIRGHASDLKISAYDDSILQLKRENRDLQLKKQSYSRELSSSETTEERKSELESLIAEVDNTIAENVGYIKELRGLKNEIIEHKADYADLNIDKEIEKLEKKIAEAAEGKAVWTQGDTERMAALNIIQAIITNRKHDFEVENIEEEIKSLHLANSDLNKMKIKVENKDKRNEINEQMDENRRKIAALQRLINDARTTQISQMKETIEQLNELISNGKNSLMRKVEEEVKRKGKIIGNGLRSVEGKPIDIFDDKAKQETWYKKFFSAPLGSFEYMCKRVNTKTLGKDGFLYKYFIQGENGVLEAYNTYLKGLKEVQDRMKAKSLEIFGKSYDKIASESDKVIKDTGVHIYDVKQGDGYGQRYEKPMSKAQAMYIYMVWKMDDGRTKLELQGFDEESIAEIVEFIGNDYVKYADWIQEELLPDTRLKYNERYLELFNTSMADIPNYVPLRIRQESIYQESDLSADKQRKKTLEERAGSLINRVVNTNPVDITMSAFDVVNQHVNQMEEWNAYARVRRDLDALLSNTTFRNQLNANVAGSLENFYDAAAVATKAYHPDRAKHMDEVLGKLSKGIVGGNIAYRLSTALKQVLSAPAFFGYSQHPFFGWKLVRNAVNMKGSYKWAKENLPSFRERVESGTAGNEKLNEKSFKKWMDTYIEWGMIPNKTIDALTCSMGARSVYDLKMRQLKKQGLNEEEARRQALMDADIYYNATQQSSHPAFMSPIQMSRTLADRMLTTYQNSNIGYVRKMLAAYYDLTRSFKWKELMANYTDMYVREEGLSEADAKVKARARLLNENRKSVIEIALFGWGLNILWNIGSQGLFGFFAGDDDDEEDKDKWTKDIGLLLTSPMKGMPGGNLIESISQGYGMNPFLVYDELEGFIKSCKYAIDEYGLISPEVAYKTLETASRYTGVDLQVWGNIYMGVEGMVRDGATDGDALIDWMYLFNYPKSAREEVAKNFYKGEPILEFAEKLNRARKYVPRTDPWEIWVPGNKPITKRQENEAKRIHERLNMTDEERKEADEKKIADKFKRKLKEYGDDEEGKKDYIERHEYEYGLYQKYYKK